METCGYQTVCWDGDEHPDAITLPCGRPATHRLALAILGAKATGSGGPLVQRVPYCCGHQKLIVAECSEPTSGVQVINNTVLGATIVQEVAERDGGWQFRMHITAHGDTETTPWLRLQATTEHGANLEAAARSAVLQENLMGGHQ